MNLNVLCNSDEQLYSALSNDAVYEIIVEADAFEKPVFEVIHEVGKKAAIAMPYVFRDLTFVDADGYDEVYIRSLDELEFYRDRKLVSDYGLYCMNSEASRMLSAHGVQRITAPVEMNQHELRQLDCANKEIIVYGHIPMMVSAQCIHKNTGKCDMRPGVTMIKDRTGKELPVENRCAYCYNLIYNPSPLSLAGIFDKVRRLEPDAVRINFTIENADESGRILETFAKAATGKQVEDPYPDFTRGHFTRGVE